jgi:HPt (histidine-containing phosphotransfer) domain-containing protein
MTANALQGDRERCLEAGMNDYVSKPVRPEELAQALHRCQPRSGQNQTSTLPIRPQSEVKPEYNSDESQPDQRAPALDASALNELRQFLGDQAPQMIAELIDLYFETTPPLLADMHAALQRGDAEALFRAAHTLKPGSAYLGAVHIAGLCAELETFGNVGQLEAAAVKLAELEAEFSRIKIALAMEKAKTKTEHGTRFS